MTEQPITESERAGLELERLKDINAELLAALEALTALVTEWSEEPCDDHSTITEGAMCQSLANCRAAIAKARAAPECPDCGQPATMCRCEPYNPDREARIYDAKERGD